MRNLFLRFRQGHIEEFWRPLWKWLLALSWPAPPGGFSLDLDSTVFQRSGNQEGAKRGYNPSRPGRNSHHPLIGFLADEVQWAGATSPKLPPDPPGDRLTDGTSAAKPCTA